METEQLTKAMAIMNEWFQFKESTVIDCVVVATSCTTKRDLVSYFNKGQKFEQVSLDCENLDVSLEKLDGTCLDKIGLGEMYFLK